MHFQICTFFNCNFNFDIDHMQKKMYMKCDKIFVSVLAALIFHRFYLFVFMFLTPQPQSLNILRPVALFCQSSCLKSHQGFYLRHFQSLVYTKDSQCAHSPAPPVHIRVMLFLPFCSSQTHRQKACYWNTKEMIQ